MHKLKFALGLFLCIQASSLWPAADVTAIKAFGTMGALSFTAGVCTHKFWPVIADKVASLKNLWSSSKPVEPTKVTIGFIELNLDEHSAWDCLIPFEYLFIDPAVQAIVMRLKGNGSYATAEAVALMIQHLKMNYPKPIIGYCEDDYLVGPQYLLCCAADSIFISPVTGVGGIDVIWTAKRMHEKNQEEGREYHFIHRGKLKGLNYEDLPHSAEFHEAAIEDCTRTYNHVVSAISALRPSIPQQTDLWAGGKILTSKQSLDLNLIDKICGKSDLFKALFERLGIPFNLQDIEPSVTAPAPLPSHVITGFGSARKMGIGILKINNLSNKTSWDYLQSIHSLFKDENVEGIVLAIDEYGSGIDLAVALHNDLLYFKSYYKKPLVAYVEHNALSGAYLIACAADKIIATPSAYVGCVGVLMAIFDETKKNAKEHIECITIKAGKDPLLFSRDIPFDDVRREALQRSVDSDYEVYVNLVKKARPALAHNESLWSEAQRLLAVNALEIGLIDQVGSPFDAFQCVKHLLNPDAQEEKIDLENIDLIVRNTDIP